MSIEVGDSNNGNKQPPKDEPVKPVHQTPAPQNIKQQQQPHSATKAEPTSSNPQPQPGTRTTMISSRQNYGVSRAPTSQAMRSIIDVIDKIAESETEQQPVKFTYHSLDREKEGLLISALVVVAAPKNPGSNEKYVAHHTLLLEVTSVADKKTEQTMGKGIRYERLIVTADAYDRVMRARVEEVVKQAYPGFKVIDADATAVPATLDLRSEEAVRNVIANATTASSTLLASMIANDGWVIDETITQNTFKNEVKSSYDHFVDLTGLPIRADVVCEMSMITGREQRNSELGQNEGEFIFNNSKPRKLITQITGYIDVVSTPPTNLSSNLYGVQAAINPADLKIYTPRLVITTVDSPETAGELPVIIQALGTLQSLQNRNLWQSVLLKQYKDGAAHQEDGINLRDLSVIGLEAPIPTPPMGFQGMEPPKPTRLPLNSNAVNDTMAMAAIQTYFNETLLISMDVEECGPSSWILGVFVAAARGDKDAVRDIFEATDMLTRGLFTPIYKALNGNQMPSPVFNDNMFVNLGNYDSSRGKRDIRDADYLSVFNATGDSEMETINDWSNLQANADVDPMFRLAEQRRIMQGLFNSMQITGRAVRVTMNPVYVHAVAAAVAEAGLVYETEMGISSPQSTSRMVAPYMRDLHTGLGAAGNFVSAGMRRADSRGSNTGSFGRYARGNQDGGNTGGSGNY